MITASRPSRLTRFIDFSALRREVFVNVIRLTLAVIVPVATLVVVITMSASWRSGDVTAGGMRIGTAFALMIPALLALAISLTNIDDWKCRLANAVITPVGSGFIVAQMVDNPHSSLASNPALTITFVCITAGGALLGALMGELLPRDIAQKAHDAIC